MSKPRGLWLVALLLTLASTAQAGTKNKLLAREAFEAGIRHYNLSEFSDALDSFKEAYRQYPDSSFLFNIGQCQRQVGDKVNAIRSYKAYLRETGNPPNRAEVQSLITAMEESVKEDDRVKNRPPQEPIGSSTPPGEPLKTEPRAPAVTTEPATPPPAIVSATPPPPPPRKSRAWVWGVVGGAAAVVAIGLGVGLGIGLSSSKDPTGTLGSVRGN